MSNYLQKEMKVLLTTINVSYIHQNLAIRTLYHFNKNYKGLEYRDFFMKLKDEDIINYCVKFDVLAFSCYIWNINRTLELIQQIKIIKSDIFILLGGPEVSFEYDELMENPAIDALIRGEGEYPFSAFLQYYPQLEQIPSLVWRKNGQIQENPISSLFDVAKLENINPYILDDKSDLKNRITYIESSRGCPYTCSFCLAGLDNNLRFLPMEAVKRNLLFLMQNGRIIKFLDRTFNANKAYTIELFQFILENYSHENIFQFEIRADILHPEIVDFILKNVPKGLFRFEVGIQTVSHKANAASKRKQDFDRVRNIIQKLSDKIEFHLDLIAGLAFDYWEDIKFSVDEVFKIHAAEIQLGFLKFLKGTSTRATASEHNYVYDTKAPYQIIESKYLSREELKKIHVVEHVLGVYWNKKRSPRAFKYLSEKMSIFDFMLQLGEFADGKLNFHKYNLLNLFDVLWNFVLKFYPKDKILHQLVSFDFYMLSKVKPSARYLKELNQKEKLKIISEKHLNHHKYRFLTFPLDLDIYTYQKSGEIVEKKSTLILKYTGTDYPEIIF